MNIKKINKIVEDNRNEAIKFLQSAIQIPSVTGDELKISQYFKNKLTEMEMNIQVIALDENRPNLIATWGDSDGPTFIFNGHYDVFPPNDDPGLYGPWSGKIVDGYMYGRGTVDMKSGLCAAVLAVDYLKKNHFQPKGTIIVSCDSDEESGGKYGIEYTLNKGLLKADFGISMEPTRSKVQIEGSGGIFLKITYHSNSWFSGEHREELDSLQKSSLAIQKLYELNEKIRVEKYYEPFNGGTFLSITEMHAGDAMNLHPDTCFFVVDRRLNPNETPDEAQAEICSQLDSLKESYPEMDYEIEMLTRMPSLKISENDPIVLAALEAYEDVYQEAGETYKRTGGSDNHKIVEKYGCSIPNFGPGLDFEECMTPNEKINIQEYLNMIKIYMGIVVKMLG